MRIALGNLTLLVSLPGCSSLKEKRSRLKPLLHRLHHEFNISAAEVAHMDVWQSAGIACAMVSNDHNFTQEALQAIPKWIEKNWPDVEVVEEHLELY